MILEQLHKDFSVCKLTSPEHVDLTNPFTFVSKTDDELSLVCETNRIPPNATDVEKGWKALKLCGILDFGLIGIIAKLSGLLAENNIPVFVISTFNTDYILLKNDHYNSAKQLLSINGYDLI